MTDRKLTHTTFVLEREYPVPATRVFHAFADPATKAKWFGADDGWTPISDAMDFREGGIEHAEGSWPDGTTSRFDARYVEIVDDLRLVYSYEMRVNDDRLSVSLASIELTPTASGTLLKLTEQGTYFDDLDNSAQREEGTRGLLESLARVLER